ncbi:MAG: DPP IV N-terminal domain-containing protein, partial [Prevotella sp.]|nr:DPP IV N-terminal domain-containing protein [Prevotella sp.]
MEINAQNKTFTLEDLNFGGNNYRNMVPKNQYYTWWGDELIRQDSEQCFLVNKKTGKEKTLFTLKQINNWVKNSGISHQVRNLFYSQFHYTDQPIVSVTGDNVFMLIDFKQKKVVWADSTSRPSALEWTKTSKATVSLDDNQLCVFDAQGNKKQLTTDGSREIVYGQSVHRNEFGIDKGTFWSPDGNRLAFYRMDQSMVADYPQVNIDARIASYEPDKYPMAGETSHVVTVGVYDLNTGKTIYLKTANPINRYFTNISWSPDNQTIY